MTQRIAGYWIRLDREGWSAVKDGKKQWIRLGSFRANELAGNNCSRCSCDLSQTTDGAANLYTHTSCDPALTPERQLVCVTCENTADDIMDIDAQDLAQQFWRKFLEGWPFTGPRSKDAEQ